MSKAIYNLKNEHQYNHLMCSITFQYYLDRPSKMYPFI